MSSRFWLSTVSAIALGTTATTAAAQAVSPAGSDAPAQAPSTTTAATDAADTVAVAEITVEAQRRSQRASEVPLALSVLSASDLQASDQLRTTNDVLQSVPNAQALQPHGPSRARWFVRGIGTNNTGSNTINPLGVYYDDVYIADISNQGYPLFDLDRVEVLNGPQGTLWGKNSNAGAINYVSAKPRFTTSGYAQAGYGSFNEKQLEAAIGGPLVGEKIAGRVALFYNDWEGWQNNRITGEKHPGATEVAGRAQLLFYLTERASLLLNAHFRNYSGAQQGTTYAASTVTTSSTPVWQSVYPNGFLTNGNWKDTFSTDTSPETLEASGANAKFVWDAEWGTVTSITALEQNKLDQDGTGAAIPTTSPYYNNGAPFSRSKTDGESRQVSQELRVSSRSDQRLTWLGGLYAFKGNVENQSITANYVRGTTPAASTSNAWGTGAQFTNSAYDHRIENYALFANLGYKFTDKFRISGGARWSTETSNFDWAYSAANIVGNQATFIPNLPQDNLERYTLRDIVFTQQAEQKTRAWTYDITPEYVFSDQGRVYFRYAHGVLPGGYTTTGNVTIPAGVGNLSLPLAATGAAPATIRAPQIFVLNPEEIDSYELGLKTSFFDRRLTVDVAAFYSDYANLVVNVPTQIDPLPANATVLFRNAGAAVIKGLEWRINAAPTRGLNLSATLGYLDSEYTKDFGQTATILGATTPRTSKYTASLRASYTHDLAGLGSLTYVVDGNWRSKYYFYPTIASQITNPDPLLVQGDVGLLNARISWQPSGDDKLTLSLSGQNLTNEQYKTHALPVSSGFSNQIYGKPRSFLVSLTAKF